jgi:hypothetical protein
VQITSLAIGRRALHAAISKVGIDRTAISRQNWAQVAQIPAALQAWIASQQLPPQQTKDDAHPRCAQALLTGVGLAFGWPGSDCAEDVSVTGY